MSALIQPIDGRSIHQIQSGQVINDGLNSAVKELVENALDAHATSIEVRFKNYGLESIEAIDNGDGISPENYESIALKHYTSKLKTYADLESVTTFGFRGEALSSLCALSDFRIITATASEVPKGSKLEFERSGKLKSQTMVAASKGTTVCVGNLFKTLPVRRRELERNFKRDYARVLGLLQAYASICVGVKFSVFNQPPKGKRIPAFATKGNPTTRENISNVFGSKTPAALIQLNLRFEMQSTKKPSVIQPTAKSPDSREVRIVGHISRPVVGEGRNAPDRQMLFVNGRPCVLPQISKAFNEVYRGFNVTQSPFIFADILLDTSAYDVNVSPDKRTILLHDQADLLENLKTALTELFEKHEQTVPISQLGTTPKFPGHKQTNLFSSSDVAFSSPLRGYRGQWAKTGEHRDTLSPPIAASKSQSSLLEEDEEVIKSVLQKVVQRNKEAPKYDLSNGLSRFAKNPSLPFKTPSKTVGDRDSTAGFVASMTADEVLINIDDSPEQEEASTEDVAIHDIPSTKPLVSPRPPPLRGQRRTDAVATITIGNRSPVISGTEPRESPYKKRRVELLEIVDEVRPRGFVSALDKFLAPGTQPSNENQYLGDGVSKRPLVSRVLDGDTNDSQGDIMEQSGPPMEVDEQAEGAGDVLSDGENTVQIRAVNENELEERPGDGDGTNNLSKNQLDDSPLILPGKYLDHGLESSENRNEEAGEGLPSPEQPEGEGDREYTPEAPAAAEQRATARAARLLREAEAYELTRPISQLLERNLRLFNDSRAITTNGTVRFEQTSLEDIQKSADQYRKASIPSFAKAVGSTSGEFLGSQDEVAEQRLTLTVAKQDFFNMKVHGQFNKGFILASRDDELFIIDQHASDEKYNFETLQTTTVVQNQPLVIPQTLDLMAMDEIAVMDNLDVLKKNGFVVEVDPELPTGRRCRLISLPMSRETVFGVEDLEELIHLIHQHQGSGMSHLRCSKVRSMFAMRACRKSIMVGRALPVKAMEKIVRHMGELDKPWNCPHGRPTMRHLAELNCVDRWTEYRSGGGLQWGSKGWRETLETYRQDGE